MAIRQARLEPLALSVSGRERMVKGPTAASKEQRIDLGAVRFATGIFTLPEAIALARPCESELLVGHGVGPDIAGRSR